MATFGLLQVNKHKSKMKKIEFKLQENGENADFLVDGVKKNSCYYPSQVSLCLRLEFGLMALHKSDLTEHPEWYKQYIEHMDEKMLKDFNYVKYANVYYKAEGYNSATSNTAASFITYKWFRAFISAGYQADMAFIAAMFKSSMSTLEHGHMDEVKEIQSILDTKYQDLVIKEPENKK